MGFRINPYDKCVANKMIDGHQCTIVWYVDDVKVSHKDKSVVQDVIKNIEDYFGDLVISEGPTHDYLGMNITIRDDRRIEIEMKNQILEAINMYGNLPVEAVSSPASGHLFTVRDNVRKLSEKDANLFHSITAKLLYIEIRWMEGKLRARIPHFNQVHLLNSVSDFIMVLSRQSCVK